MAVLRFHYMRKLEDELTKDDKNFVMWMSFSSPVTTRNIKHLKNKYKAFNIALKPKPHAPLVTMMVTLQKPMLTETLLN